MSNLFRAIMSIIWAALAGLSVFMGADSDVAWFALIIAAIWHTSMRNN